MLLVVDAHIDRQLLVGTAQGHGTVVAQALAANLAGAVKQARKSLQALLGAAFDHEIVFTSGATESDNLAIKGVAEYYKAKGNHIITTTIEHKAVLDSCKRLPPPPDVIDDRDGLAVVVGLGFSWPLYALAAVVLGFAVLSILSCEPAGCDCPCDCKRKESRRLRAFLDFMERKLKIEGSAGPSLPATASES